MSKVLAYFIGGSHDLEKLWVEERLHHVEMTEVLTEYPYVIREDSQGRAKEVICKVEVYQRIARLHGRRDAYVYECSNE
jgi:hypothetical protein